MAESSLTLTYDDFTAEDGLYLGHGRDDSLWSTAELAEIDADTQAGVRQWYNPPSLKEGEPAHEWSFLKKTATLSLANADYDYALPDDYGGGIKWFTYAAADAIKTIEIISEEQLLTLRAMNNATGSPQYAAIRQLAFVATTGQRHEAIFYPTPNATKVLSYTYRTRPDKISSTNKYAYGSSDHSDTILASILAVSELRKNDEKGIMWQSFMEKLAMSIARDVALTVITQVAPWSQTESTTLQVTYLVAQREIGKELGIGPDTATWKASTLHMVCAQIQNAWRRVCLPILESGNRYIWSWLNPVSTLQLYANDDTYDLPSDFSGITAPFTLKEIDVNTIPWNGDTPYELGDEILQDNYFEATTYWNFGAGWAHTAGTNNYSKRTSNAPSGAVGELYQNTNQYVTEPVKGALYRVEMDIVAISGGLRIAFGEDGSVYADAAPGYGTARTAIGRYVELIPASGMDEAANKTFRVLPLANTTTASVYMASVKQVTNVDDVVVLGDESVSNGSFATDDNWTAGAGWTYDDDNLCFTHAAGDTESLDQVFASQAVPLEVGLAVYYYVEADITFTAGSVFVQLDAGAYGYGPTWTEGDECKAFVAATYDATTLDIEIVPSTDFVGSINSISIKRVIGFRKEIV